MSVPEKSVPEQAWSWLTTASSWSGDSGIGMRIAEHLGYSFLATFLSAIIGIGLGIFVGHTGRGQAVVLGVSGIFRAMPTLGLLTFLALIIPAGITMPLIPATIVLVFLAVPPILAATASGFRAIDRSTIDAAYAMGHSTWQVISSVELPLAMPVLVGGLRSAWLQVLATATVAAYLGLGGLGRYLLDALAVRDYGIMLGAAIIVAVLALISDALFSQAERAFTPAGLRLGKRS
ncbi:ABC transporter permease [Corynebacterium sp. H113]|uniref:ABC transporter permease n=1 Tax=Corynebacterium sp. H113 TaxID=3133419 RepID=UPI0030A8588C